MQCVTPVTMLSGTRYAMFVVKHQPVMRSHGQTFAVGAGTWKAGKDPSKTQKI